MTIDPATGIDLDFEAKILAQFEVDANGTKIGDEGEGTPVDEPVDNATPDESLDEPLDPTTTDATIDETPVDGNVLPDAGDGTPNDATVLDSYLGRSRADVEAALQTLDWARNLPADALRGIDAYLSGQYTLVPIDDAAAAPPTPVVTATAFDDEDLDPAVASQLSEMRKELAALRATTTDQVRYQQNAQEQNLLAAIESGGAKFATTRSLSQEDLDRVMTTAAKLATMQTGTALHPHDAEKAVLHALDLAYLSDPDFRQREIDSRAATQLEDSRRLAERKARAGAVSSSGGNIRKPSPTPPSAMTPEQRLDAMTEELAQAMALR